MLYIRGMNIMKRVYIVKFITALGLLAILSLQIIWLYNMYMLLWNDKHKKKPTPGKWKGELSHSPLWAFIRLP